MDNLEIMARIAEQRTIIQDGLIHWRELSKDCPFSRVDKKYKEVRYCETRELKPNVYQFCAQWENCPLTMKE